MDFTTFVFGTTWLIVSAVLGIISLILLGIFYNEEEDGDGFIAIKATLAMLASIFWPICISIGAFVLTVAALIYFGKWIKKLVVAKKIKQQEKEHFFKQLKEYEQKGG